MFTLYLHITRKANCISQCLLFETSTIDYTVYQLLRWLNTNESCIIEVPGIFLILLHMLLLISVFMSLLPQGPKLHLWPISLDLEHY